MLDQNKVTVNKVTLLDTIKANRDTHIAEYMQAASGYRVQLLGVLSGLLAALHDGSDVSLREAVMLAKPVNHVEDYNSIIKMLEMSVGDTATLSEDQFERYVMDDWNWKAQHRDISASYGVKR